MNILHFLKSCRGKVAVGPLAAMAATVGLAGLSIAPYFKDQPAAMEPEVRALASIINSGGELPAEYSSIKINMDRMADQLATTQERARMQNTSMFDGGEAAVAALEGANFGGLSDAVQRRNFNGATDGLGMGANDVQLINGSAAGKANAGDVSAAAIGAAARGAQGTQVNSLKDAGSSMPRATMARATGTEYGAGATGSFGGREGQSLSATGAGSIQFGNSGSSGASMIRVTESMHGTRSSSYVPSSRNAKFQEGGANSRAGNDLRSIAVQSSKIATMRNKGPNAMDAPFFTASTKEVSGMKLEGENEVLEEPEAAFEDKLDKQEDDLDKGLKDVDNSEQERSAHRDRLGQTAFATLSAAFIAMLLIHKLKQGGLWSKIGALAITAVVATVIAAFVIDTADYIKKYGGGLQFIAAGLLASTFLVLGWTVSTAKTSALTKFRTFLGTEWGSMLKGMAMIPMWSFFSAKTSVNKVIFNEKLDGLENGKR